MCEAGLRGGPCGCTSILAELRHRGCLAEGCGKFCIVFVSVGSINIPYIVTAGLRVTRVARGLLLMHTSRRAGGLWEAAAGYFWCLVAVCFRRGRQRRERCLFQPHPAWSTALTLLCPVSRRALEEDGVLHVRLSLLAEPTHLLCGLWSLAPSCSLAGSGQHPLAWSLPWNVGLGVPTSAGHSPSHHKHPPCHGPRSPWQEPGDRVSRPWNPAQPGLSKPPGRSLLALSPLLFLPSSPSSSGSLPLLAGHVWG